MSGLPVDPTTTRPPVVSGGRVEMGLARGGSLRWVAADITDVLEEARRRLDLSPIAAVALGRAMSGATLLQRIFLKVPARIVLEVNGDGPLGKIVAECDAAGRLRGTVGSPRLETPPDGRMRISPLVGRGLLRVTREGPRRRYSSQVALVSGELGDDLTHYLEQSEQIRSAVLLGVLPCPTGIAAAGGLIVEALPGSSEETLTRLEANIRTLEGVSAHLRRGGIGALLGAVLRGLDRERIDGRALEYSCRCSRQGLLAQLLPVARAERETLFGDSDVCEAVCAFCGDRHVFTEAELRAGY